MTDGTSSVEWIANIIHDNVGGELIPIIPSEEYPLEYEALADYAKKERDDGGRPAFENLSIDPAGYDVVFIGYPIWWYEMPMIMDTLFDTYDFSGVTIVPFNTHAGSGDGGTYSDIKELEPNATVLEGLAVPGEDAGKDIENAKADFANVQAQLNTAQEALKKFEGISVDELKGEITKLQSELKSKDDEYKKQIADRDFEDILKSQIAEMKGRNAKAVRALLDIDALKASHNQAQDIKTALETVKKEADYLFASDEQAPPFSTGAGTHSTGGNGHADDIAKFRAAMGLKPVEE